MKRQPIVHLVLSFVGGAARVPCPIRYVSATQVSAYPVEVTCKSCQRARREGR